jgi:hypothetical protein
MVSNLGRVLSLKGGFKRLLVKTPDVYKSKKRYLTVYLCKKGHKPIRLRVHHLVARHFLEYYSKDLVVNHINEIKTDNRLVNIEMITHRENLHWSHKPSATNPYPNITYYGSRKRYLVQISNKGIKYNKSFRTLEESIKYKNKIYKEIYGQ